MIALEQNKNRIISLKQAKSIIIFIIFVFLFDFVFFPVPLLAMTLSKNNKEPEIIKIIKKENYNQEKIEKIEIKEIKEIIKYTSTNTITAYNSEKEQCDDSPCITANGFNVCEHGIEDTIATNALKFGTKVRIPELFGDRIFIVRDRMNKRYDDSIDVWMKRKIDAKTI